MSIFGNPYDGGMSTDSIQDVMAEQQAAIMRQRDFYTWQKGALNQAMQNNIPRPPQEKTSSTETLLLLLD